MWKIEQFNFEMVNLLLYMIDYQIFFTASSNIIFPPNIRKNHHLYKLDLQNWHSKVKSDEYYYYHEYWCIRLNSRINVWVCFLLDIAQSDKASDIRFFIWFFSFFFLGKNWFYFVFLVKILSTLVISLFVRSFFL